MSALPSHSEQVAVIGGGSWGTALVKVLLQNVGHVNWYVRGNNQAEHIQAQGFNPSYLQNIKFDTSRIGVSSELTEVIESAQILIVAVPSAYVDSLFGSLREALHHKKIFSALKGIVAGAEMTPSRYFHKICGIPYDHLGVISGPCHAEEVAQERLSYLTVAGADDEVVEGVANLLRCAYMSVTTSNDLRGTELAGVLKNVYAIAAGMAEGLGYGANFQAVLVANCLLEMERFLDAASPVHRDVKHSAYLGDLLVTAYSDLSRNRQLGKKVGSGSSTQDALLGMEMVAEGYYSARSVLTINTKYGVNLPIADAVYRVLHQGTSPAEEFRAIERLLI